MEAFSTGKKLYFKGTEYRLSLSFSNDYPFKPPEVKFETSCFHILMWMYVATFVWTFFSIYGGDWFISVCHSSIAIGQGLVYGGDLSRVAVSRKLSDPRKQQV
ncbi:hypothetical protein F8388_012697 [Cannabis sativa]|uniref:UBC core domain-containing protein n=1 Tax=Cannabis sativa TaxID=3483 RepID=A0A7J6HBD7_CANSA|nr:hypothetical protein F8388_012697 [Cannabis sativa]